MTHIDDYAIESLAKYYSENLESNTNLVDLCSSWISHLPKTLDFSQVIGIGMNEQELQKNSRLTKYYVHDLNKNPELKMIPDESIDTVLCAVSVDYLIRVSYTIKGKNPNGYLSLNIHMWLPYHYSPLKFFLKSIAS